jgi:hypothetical protein
VHGEVRDLPVLSYELVLGGQLIAESGGYEEQYEPGAERQRGEQVEQGLSVADADGAEEPTTRTDLVERPGLCVKQLRDARVLLLGAKVPAPTPPGEGETKTPGDEVPHRLHLLGGGEGAPRDPHHPAGLIVVCYFEGHCYFVVFRASSIASA